MRWFGGLAVVLACSACPGKSTTTGSGTGTNNPGSGGSGSAKPDRADPTVTSCDAAKAKVASLYRVEGLTGKDAKRIDDFVADNVAMVMADCAKQPAKVVPCLASAATVADIETKCLELLDDEGTEGDKLRRVED